MKRALGIAAFLLAGPANAQPIDCPTDIQLPQVWGDDHFTWSRQRLQPCCDVGRLTDNGTLLRSAFTDDVSNHYGSGGDSDAHRQWDVEIQIWH